MMATQEAYGRHLNNASTSSAHRVPIGSPSGLSASSGSLNKSMSGDSDLRSVARTHFGALRAWLAREGALGTNPSRSNARQKLTRLTRQQFQELSTDVYDELMRRQASDQDLDAAPEFLPVRNDFHPKRNGARQKLATLPRNRFCDLASDVYYELERRYPDFLEEMPQPQQSASNDVVVPNKSTLVMDDGSEHDHQQPQHHQQQRSAGSLHSVNDAHSQRSALSPPESASRGLVDGDVSPTGAPSDVVGELSPRPQPPHAPFHHSRASEASSIGTRFLGNYAGSTAPSESGGARKSWDHDELERTRQKYEYEITMLKRQVGDLSAEAQRHRMENEALTRDASKSRELQDEVARHEGRFVEQSSTISRLEMDLSTASENVARAEATIQRLEDELAHASRSGANGNGLADEELQGELRSLVNELASLSERHQVLQDECENERQARLDAEDRAADWRRQYEQTVAELRNYKASPHFAVDAPHVGPGEMPTSLMGAVADVNVAAFQTSLDELLQSSRSSTPATLLNAARKVVYAIEQIDADVQAHESSRGSAAAANGDEEGLLAAKSRINATLSILMSACKNHVAGFGVSPVGLIDSAAGQVSSAVIELVRIVKVRKTNMGSPMINRDSPAGSRASPTGSYRMQPPPRKESRRMASGSGSTEAATPYSTSSPRTLQNASYVSDAHDSYISSPPSAVRRHPMQTPSQEDSIRQRVMSPTGSPFSPKGGMNGMRNQPRSEEEFQDYLEVKTDAIVGSIKELLSAIKADKDDPERSPDFAELNGTLTQITSIASSIVSISRDTYWIAAKPDVEGVLHELTDNCERLSEIQRQLSPASFTKATKQSMAGASFGVAKSLKTLKALFMAVEDDGEGLT